MNELNNVDEGTYDDGNRVKVLNKVVRSTVKFHGSSHSTKITINLGVA